MSKLCAVKLVGGGTCRRWSGHKGDHRLTLRAKDTGRPALATMSDVRALSEAEAIRLGFELGPHDAAKLERRTDPRAPLMRDPAPPHHCKACAAKGIVHRQAVHPERGAVLE